MSSLSVSAVVLAHSRRDFLATAVRSSLDAGADEVIVVRSFSGPIEGVDGLYRDIRCDCPETGLKHAIGVEAATGDLVGFLDDDDLWEPGKVARLRQQWMTRPDLTYLSHRQQAIDRTGHPVTARHREFAGREPARFVRWDPSDFPDLIDRIWPGNGSSTVVARSWALGWLPALREVRWSADTFWLVAAVLSGRPLERMAVLDEPLTRLRLHDENMSHVRGTTAQAFRRRHGAQSRKFAEAFEAMTHLANAMAGSTASITRCLAAKAVDFRFFAELEEGTHARDAARRALATGQGIGDPGAFRAAMVAAFAPSLARWLLYRSSLRRWRLA